MKKVALITGAYKGLGLEISRQLGNQDMIVLLGARDQAKAEASAEILKTENIEAYGVELDVTNSDHIQSLAAHIKETFGRLDILLITLVLT